MDVAISNKSSYMTEDQYIYICVCVCELYHISNDAGHMETL